MSCPEKKKIKRLITKAYLHQFMTKKLSMKRRKPAHLIIYVRLINHQICSRNCIFIFLIFQIKDNNVFSCLLKSLWYILMKNLHNETFMSPNISLWKSTRWDLHVFKLASNVSKRINDHSSCLQDHLSLKSLSICFLKH
jgi:hypothetical protein